MAIVDDPVSDAPPTPTHLWVVGGLSLLWNLFGANDYLMTQLRVESYLANFTPEQLEYFTTFPAWFEASWAFGVWGAVAGSVGLLLRKWWATWAFGVSILGLGVSSIYNFVLSNGFEVMGAGIGLVIFNLVIWTVAIALFIYSRAMVYKGVLR